MSKRRPGGFREEDNCGELARAPEQLRTATVQNKKELSLYHLMINKERERKKVLEKEGQEGEEKQCGSTEMLLQAGRGIFTQHVCVCCKVD